MEVVNRHRIEIKLAAQYLNCPPDIRWLSPLWHPNVGFGGLVALPYRLQWDRDLGLDFICECLWDVVCASYVDLAHSIHPLAQAFFRQRHGLHLPVDSRRCAIGQPQAKLNATDFSLPGESSLTGAGTCSA